MNSAQAPAILPVRNYSPIFEKMPQDKESEAIKSHIEYLRGERDTCEKLLTGTRKDRFDGKPRLYGETLGDKTEKFDRCLKYLMIGSGVLGAAAFIGGIASGVATSLLRVIGHVAVVGTMLILPRVFDFVTDRWILPGVVDRSMKKELRKERAELDGSITRAQEDLKSREARLLSNIKSQTEQKRENPGVVVDDSRDCVVIDKIRLGKNKNADEAKR